jgi:hypothetical protein
LALLGRLSWERVDAFVMQASEKPAQKRKFRAAPNSNLLITTKKSPFTVSATRRVVAVRHDRRPRHAADDEQADTRR